MPDQVYLLYNLRNSDLRLLYEQIWKQIVANGATITVSDLGDVIEERIFGADEKNPSENGHHETAISNGVDIFLHYEMEDGLMGRIYDLLHLGVGHFIQWNSNSKSGLKFYGDYAWEVATRFYLGVPEKQLAIARAYELEAGRIALGNLKMIMAGCSDFNDKLTESFLNFFNDYVNTDLEYIINYYRNGVLTNFFGGWKFNSEKILPISLSNQVLEIPQKRDSKCIPLLRKLD